MDEFAQSRGDDDLFDDEIIPFDTPPSPEKVAVQLEQVSPEAPPTPATDESLAASAPVPSLREESSASSRGKPRGRGGSTTSRGSSNQKGGLGDSKWAIKPAKSPSASIPLVKEEPLKAATPIDEPAIEEKLSSVEEGDPTTTAPPGPANPNPRPPAVRGDRTATGGVRKPKLTEEELTAKLAAAKERSQNVAAAHARALADAASFEERERTAERKRAKDRVERKAMDNEREKNRQRKMAVTGGREWDAGKNEDDFKTNGTGRGGRRGYQSGSTPQQQFQQEEDYLKMYEWNDDRGRGRGNRGRGGRGGRGRGRGGRGGGFNNGENQSGSGSNQQQPDWSADADFPTLPGSSATSKKQPEAQSDTSKQTLSKWDSGNLRTSGDNGGGGGSWAEQVESNEALNEQNTTKTKTLW